VILAPLLYNKSISQIAWEEIVFNEKDKEFERKIEENYQRICGIRDSYLNKKEKTNEHKKTRRTKREDRNSQIR
jgi:hypothetical protein